MIHFQIQPKINHINLNQKNTGNIYKKYIYIFTNYLNLIFKKILGIEKNITGNLMVILNPKNFFSILPPVGGCPGFVHTTDTAKGNKYLE